MDATEHLTLANGLHLVLCHAPRLKRSAASLRVAVGSHDAPAAWPGLAHFLEHLFFLGTQRFPVTDNLMSFVQRHGGQVNASTGERCTDFFCELPPTALAEGLARLCDMLAQPRMAIAEQLREREVLHAEFIAWSRDAARHQSLAALSPRHPLRGFHAGNRYSLPVPSAAFQQGLQAFYRRFYQAGQMRLCLAGPQPLDELRAMALHCGGWFAPGVKVAQLRPPPLFDQPSTTPLLFGCEGLPEKADEAVAFLCGWLDEAKVLYQFAGQVLLRIEYVADGPFANKFAATRCADHPVGSASAATGPKIFSSWLAFFNANWPALRHPYNLRQQRRLQTCGALELAHHHARALPGELSDQGARALSALIEQLPMTTAGTAMEWQLPAPNPFLATSPPVDEEAALFLRWQLPAPQPALWQTLDSRLGELIGNAREAGVDLAFSAYDVYWQMSLIGLAAPIPAIVGQALKCLTDPALQCDRKTIDEPPLIPIRQLLKHLPNYRLPAPSAQTEDLAALWQSARWIALGHGLPLTTIPGSPAPFAPPATLACGRHWYWQPCQSTEHALLLFCPTPSLSLADEAAWRLLAHLAQAPFYQRLRVELQLGYAVLSGIRQLNGQTGWLFGVQSPDTSVARLAEHIEGFIATLPRLIASADLPAQAKALAAQFDPATLDHAQAAQLRWQAHLAGHGADYLPALRNAIGQLDATALQQAASALKETFIYIATRRPERLPPALD